MARVRDAMKISYRTALMEQHHDFESTQRRVPGQARSLRGPARSAAAPHQEERGEHPRHPDRAHHPAVSRGHRPDAGAQPRRGRRVPRHGGDADPHQVQDAAARPETAAAVEGEEEDPRDALVRRLLEHQKFKAAAGLLHEREQVRSAQWQRPDERVAALAGEDYEPELEVDLFSLLTAFQKRRRAREAAAEGAAAARTDVGRGRGSSSCWRGCRKPRRAASKSCSPTPTIAAASSSRFWRCSR